MKATLNMYDILIICFTGILYYLLLVAKSSLKASNRYVFIVCVPVLSSPPPILASSPLWKNVNNSSVSKSYTVVVPKIGFKYFTDNNRKQKYDQKNTV